MQIHCICIVIDHWPFTTTFWIFSTVKLKSPLSVKCAKHTFLQQILFFTKWHRFSSFFSTSSSTWFCCRWFHNSDGVLCVPFAAANHQKAWAGNLPSEKANNSRSFTKWSNGRPATALSQKITIADISEQTVAGKFDANSRIVYITSNIAEFQNAIDYNAAKVHRREWNSNESDWTNGEFDHVDWFGWHWHTRIRQTRFIGL